MAKSMVYLNVDFIYTFSDNELKKFAKLMICLLFIDQAYDIVRFVIFGIGKDQA